MIQHYMLHRSDAKETGEDISVQSFLFDHFVHPDHEDESHENLPFHSYNTNIQLILQQFDYHLISNKEAFLFHNFSLNGNVVISEFTPSIEHPPAIS